MALFQENSTSASSHCFHWNFLLLLP